MDFSSAADRSLIRSLNGLWAGQLDSDERAALDRVIADGLAIRDYSASGMLGIAKIRIIDEPRS